MFWKKKMLEISTNIYSNLQLKRKFEYLKKYDF